MPDDVMIRDLIADVKAVRAHHGFTRDRIGQPGCEVRRVAAEYVEIMDRVLAALRDRTPRPGWRLVPVELTEDMAAAAVPFLWDSAPCPEMDITRAWPAMLAAAPDPAHD